MNYTEACAHVKQATELCETMAHEFKHLDPKPTPEELFALKKLLCKFEEISYSAIDVLDPHDLRAPMPPSS